MPTDRKDSDSISNIVKYSVNIIITVELEKNAACLLEIVYGMHCPEIETQYLSEPL